MPLLALTACKVINRTLKVTYKNSLAVGIMGQAADGGVFEKLDKAGFNFLVLPVHGAGLLVGAAI